MDTITLLLTALVNGAAEGLKKTANEAIKSAYESLRDYICKKFSKIPIEQIEKDPNDKQTQEFARIVIEKEACTNDQELLQLARALVSLLEKEKVPLANIEINNSSINAETQKGNVIVGSIIKGSVSYTQQEFNHLSPRQRLEFFRASPQYVEFMSHQVSVGFPTRYLMLFIFGILFIPLLGSGLYIMYVAANKMYKHWTQGIGKFAAIVTNKERKPGDSFTSLTYDLLKEDGSTVSVVVPSRLYDQHSIGSVGLAFVTGSGELREFVGIIED